VTEHNSKEQITEFSTTTAVRLVNVEAEPYVIYRVTEEKFKRLLDQIGYLTNALENTGYDFHLFLATLGVALSSWPAWYTTEEGHGKIAWLGISLVSSALSLSSMIRWLAKRESIPALIDKKIRPLIAEMMQSQTERKVTPSASSDKEAVL